MEARSASERKPRSEAITGRDCAGWAGYAAFPLQFRDEIGGRQVGCKVG